MLGGLALLAGCQTAGAPQSDRFTPAFLQANLIKGRTTKQELIAIYGQPEDWSHGSSGYEDLWWKEGQAAAGLNTGQLLSTLGVPGAGAVNAATDAGPRARRLTAKFHNGILVNYELFGGA